MWRGGLFPVGWRSRPKACLLGVSGVAGVGLLGLLRSPARASPLATTSPLHNGRSGRGRQAGAVNVERGLVPRWVAKPPQNLLARCVWGSWGGFVGAAAQPSAGKPARHNKPACHNGRSGRSRQAGAVNVERGLVPRWVAKPPQSLFARCVWGSWGGFVGAAAQPSAGQARSPRQARLPQV